MQENCEGESKYEAKTYTGLGGFLLLKSFAL
jgi:hypothetical protein